MCNHIYKIHHNTIFIINVSICSFHAVTPYQVINDGTLPAAYGMLL